MVNQNFLVCLTGLPASGKTTFANKLKIYLEKKFNTHTVKIIDPDKIRENLSPNKFDHILEPTVREKSLAEIKNELNNGHIVISDDLNYYSSMRHDLKILAENLKIHFFIIYISTPFNVCMKWNKKRGEPIPNKIIKRIHKKFDNFGKYNWDHPEAQYDLSNERKLDEEIGVLINKMLKKIELDKDTLKKGERKQISSNLNNENLDRITRVYVGNLLHDSEFLSLKKDIIKARKEFVSQHKNTQLTELNIPKIFKNYLEKSLNIKISKDFL
ncbi:MAG: adenylyl-sulfate kinase [Promethearchaeota archaeon]